jgi:hypothetical protein
MVPKRENMLEAFRSAGKADPIPTEPPPLPDPPAAKPAPKQAQEPGSKSTTVPVRPLDEPATAAEPAPRISRRELEQAVSSFPSWLGWAVLIVIAFVGGVLVGRSTAGPVSAAEPTEEARGEDLPTAGIVPASAAQRPAGSERAEELREDPNAPLLDRDNEYTVVVATYGSTQEDLALATFDHLRDEGLPVFFPYQVGDKIVVFAGAGPMASDLVDLEKRVHALSRDGVRGVYDDAYRVRIDRYVDR